MAKSSAYASGRRISLQEIAARFLLVFLFVGALLLAVIGRMDNAQAKLGGFFAPIGSFLSSPIESTTGGIGEVHQAFDNAKNANQLAQENKLLREWKARAEQLQVENTTLHRLLKVAPTVQHKELTARVLGSVAGPYRHQWQIAAGSRDGVQQNMVAIDSDGLVGRVMNVNSSNSTVMAVTDINSRVAVITGKSREHAVVKGVGDNYLSLFYLPDDSQLQLGEKIYTSGDSGLMPTGILVGTVTEITKTEVKVTPAITRGRLSYVGLMLTEPEKP